MSEEGTQLFFLVKDAVHVSTFLQFLLFTTFASNWQRLEKNPNLHWIQQENNEQKSQRLFLPTQKSNYNSRVTI